MKDPYITREESIGIQTKSMVKGPFAMYYRAISNTVHLLNLLGFPNNLIIPNNILLVQRGTVRVKCLA